MNKYHSVRSYQACLRRNRAGQRGIALIMVLLILSMVIVLRWVWSSP